MWDWRPSGLALCLQMLPQKLEHLSNQSPGHGEDGGTHLALKFMPDAQRKWVARFRKSVHVCGVGDGPGQVRLRHVALLATCFPGWDGKWESNLKLCSEIVLRGRSVTSPLHYTMHYSALEL